MSESTQDEAHTGPIKNPKQLLVAVLLSFVIPVIIIIALVHYVTSGEKPSGSADAGVHTLGGVSPQDMERGVSQRIRKVGAVEVRDANRPLQAGAAVYQAQCAACHAAGVAGAPKLGDTVAWAARIKTGFEALVASSLKGKGAMPAQAGGDFEDLEIARAVAYMANSAGATIAEPQRPAVATTAAASGAAAPVAMAEPAAMPVVAAVPPPPVAAPAAAATQVAAAGGAGEALYKQACIACHAAGVANAPKLGDKAAWAPRLALGVQGLTKSVVNGKGAMPPKGGSAATEPELRAAVEYMVGTVK